MRFINYQDLFDMLSEDTVMEKSIKQTGIVSTEKVLNVSRFNQVERFMTEDEDGVLISYPNEELLEKKFLIRRKMRYLPSLYNHKHTYIELVYVLDGRFEQVINDQTLDLKKGDLLFLDKNTVHSISHLDESVTAVNMLFTEPFFDGIFLNLFSNSDHISEFILNSLYSKSKSKNFLVFHIDEQSPLEDLLQRFLLEYFDSGKSSPAAINGYLLIIFSELSRLFNDEDSVFDDVWSEEKEKKEEVLKYLTIHFKNLSLNDLARHFHFHPTYMSNFIKKSFGKTFQEIMIEIRLEHAKKLLKTTNQSIEEIVSSVGYNNKSHFYKLFKKTYGLTPNQFRKKREST